MWSLMHWINMFSQCEATTALNTSRRSDLKSERRNEHKLKLLWKFPQSSRVTACKESSRFNWRVFSQSAFPLRPDARCPRLSVSRISTKPTKIVVWLKCRLKRIRSACLPFPSRTYHHSILPSKFRPLQTRTSPTGPMTLSLRTS